MRLQSTFVEDLSLIKRLYNTSEKPFAAALIGKAQRKDWKKIKQCDFCKPSETELAKAGKVFLPLMLKRLYGQFSAESQLGGSS